MASIDPPPNGIGGGSNLVLVGVTGAPAQPQAGQTKTSAKIFKLAK